MQMLRSRSPRWSQTLPIRRPPLAILLQSCRFPVYAGHRLSVEVPLRHGAKRLTCSWTGMRSPGKLVRTTPCFSGCGDDSSTHPRPPRPLRVAPNRAPSRPAAGWRCRSPTAQERRGDMIPGRDAVAGACFDLPLVSSGCGMIRLPLFEAQGSGGSREPGRQMIRPMAGSHRPCSPLRSSHGLSRGTSADKVARS